MYLNRIFEGTQDSIKLSKYRLIDLNRAVDLVVEPEAGEETNSSSNDEESEADQRHVAEVHSLGG